jgi:putative colanic acid biosynthesis acetyltransferase WcaF
MLLIRGASAWERARETVWECLGQPVMRLTPSPWHGARRVLLRLFGARLDSTARIARSVRVHHPWNLVIGGESEVCDDAILFCLGPVRIGRRCRVSQFAHLCAGSHDYSQRAMPLVKAPIVLEDDVWIAADVFVGPGVTIGHDSVIGARATVLHSRPPNQVCVGDSARPARPRTWRGPHAMPAAPEGGAP